MVIFKTLEFGDETGAIATVSFFWFERYICLYRLEPVRRSLDRKRRRVGPTPRNPNPNVNFRADCSFFYLLWLKKEMRIPLSISEN